MHQAQSGFDALVLQEKEADDAAEFVRGALLRGAGHVRDHVDYARLAVYNNHLLTEALGLYAIGTLFAGTPEMQSLRDEGRQILEEEARRQFYEDGAYIHAPRDESTRPLVSQPAAVVPGACRSALFAGDSSDDPRARCQPTCLTADSHLSP